MTLSMADLAYLKKAGITGQIVGRVCCFQKVDTHKSISTQVEFMVGAVTLYGNDALYLTPTTPIITPFLGTITHFRFSGDWKWKAMGDVMTLGIMSFE